VTEAIWSAEYIRQNPELAATAISSLQLIIQDHEKSAADERKRICSHLAMLHDSLSLSSDSKVIRAKEKE
jgi:hypothetical protein